MIFAIPAALIGLALVGGFGYYVGQAAGLGYAVLFYAVFVGLIANNIRKNGLSSGAPKRR